MNLQKKLKELEKYLIHLIRESPPYCHIHSNYYKDKKKDSQMLSLVAIGNTLKHQMISNKIIS